MIGLTWDCVRLDEGELLISKTLRRDGTATHQRLGSGTKTDKTHVVPLCQQVVVVLRQHRKTMHCLGLNTKDGLVFVTPRTHGHLYDSDLEKVWKRSQRRVGPAFMSHHIVCSTEQVIEPLPRRSTAEG